MASKNQKRGKRLIESARQRKRERFKSMTPMERKEYEKLKKQKRLHNGYEYKLSFKENLLIALLTIVAISIICGIIYLVYLVLSLII